MNSDVISHYDLLIDENNDPVNDPKPLKEYMDQWDGQAFIDALQLDATKSVLEIGVGTGRLALKVVPFCKEFTGIDISPKTVARAKQHLGGYKNAALFCGDYLTFHFSTTYDVIYSSLTWLHIWDKQAAMHKTAALLTPKGRFVLSVSKEQTDTIDYGTRKIRVFPDNQDGIKSQIENSGLSLTKMIEVENAFIFCFRKMLGTRFTFYLQTVLFWHFHKRLPGCFLSLKFTTEVFSYGHSHSFPRKQGGRLS